MISDIFNTDLFVDVQPGTYQIGISQDAANDIIKNLDSTLKPVYIYHAIPRYAVEIEEFHISPRPVTLAQFRQFLNNTGYQTEAEIEGWGWTWDNGWTKKENLTWENPFGMSADGIYTELAENVPVLQVSCNDARAFCYWLQKETGIAFRLPLEQEWEAFAYSVGVSGMNDPVGPAVLTLPGTTLDFIEMLAAQIADRELIYPGLVWEWTDSWFDAYPGAGDHDEYGTTYKVLRGGSLMSTSIQKSRQYRFRRCPTARSPFYSFRVVY
ncbi:MAG: formylglycine-generating enzyme family protein [Spirochaetota bacterium]